MNKTALITGATSGIGAACARKFAGAGYRVIITARRAEQLAVMAGDLQREFGVEALPLCFDVRDRDAVKRALDSIPAAWRDIDVLINNAGLALGLEPEYAGDFTDWETMIDTNVKGLLYMTRLVVPGMVERLKGHVINIGSVAGDAAYAGGAVYCATKAAVKVLPHRPGPHAGPRDEPQTRSGGDQFQQCPLPRRYRPRLQRL